MLSSPRASSEPRPEHRPSPAVTELDRWSRAPGAERCFVFVTAPFGPFSRRLARELRARGARCKRVLVNGGDVMDWGLREAALYRGRPADWPRWVADYFKREKATDLIIHGSVYSHAQQAAAEAHRLGMKVHVFEEGYIRPDFVTLEIGGVNGHSPLPRDPAWYREQARSLPPYGPEQSVPTSFRRRAMQDVLYSFAQMLLAWQYPFYRSHRPLHPLVEYGGWLWRFANQEAAQRRSEAVLRRLGADPRRYFVFPLQLDSDYQIRLHSPYNGMQPAIEQVLRSFAAHAPDDTILVVKDHPLDNGLINWRRLVATVAASCGVGPRVLHLEVGDVGPLVRGAAGMVTVNSTTGTLALACGVPVITLGDAVYNIPDVTFQGELDMFWRAPTPPDPATYDAFRRVLLARCLVRGGYFSEVGLDMLVRGSLTRLEQAASVHAVQRAPASRLPAPAVLAAARG